MNRAAKARGFSSGSSFPPAASRPKCRVIIIRSLPAVVLPATVVAQQVALGVGGGLPVILVATALGVAIAAALPNGRLATFTTAVVAVLLVSASFLQGLQAHDSFVAAASPVATPAVRVEVTAGDRRSVPAEELGPTQLETFSVVLPCAYEGRHAERTVEALWQHTRKDRLKEIIVVDDGSVPPLSLEFPQRLLRGGPGMPPVRLIRHEKTRGLIAAKQTGGDAAKGDVIVFFDCHIKPRDGWEDAFLRQMKRRGDHRTVVVPTITSLDERTWQEIDGAHSKACYMLWNADFTWLGNPGRDVPVMSGGLLAMSRRWWQETGGYDERMVAWGGENIDQSIRTWLCGGRIELADGAFVAHMWRDQNIPETRLKYPMPTEDVMRNKARAVSAWLGEFLNKTLSFPEYEDFVTGRQSIGDLSNFLPVKERLQCKPFSWYLQRFSYVYLDSGLVPEEIFQVREETTGLCLEREPRESPGHAVVLAPCAHSASGISGSTEEVQLWHTANRDRSRSGGPCCSGLNNWNFLQCLDSHALGATLSTFECDIAGYSTHQFFNLRPAGAGLELAWQSGLGCAAPGQRPSQSRSMHDDLPACGVRPEAQIGGTVRLRIDRPGASPLCAAAPKAPGKVFSVLRLEECSDSREQAFRKEEVADGFKLVAESAGLCLDTSGGNQLLAYQCYPGSQSPNQVWEFVDNRLVWEARGATAKATCLDFDAASRSLRLKPVMPSPNMALKSCATKRGQRFKRFDVQADGTFLLQDEDSGRCLAASPGAGLERTLRLTACGSPHRWRELPKSWQVQHVGTSFCLDAGVEDVPIIYPCHQPKAGRKQRFKVTDSPGSVQMARGWEDNGRKVFFEKCIDYAPEPSLPVVLESCSAAAQRGVRWTRVRVRSSPEFDLWRRAEKPPLGAPPLGGDAAPP